MQAILKRHKVAEALEHSLGMFVVTDASGIAVYANEGAQRRTGYSVAEIIGKKPGRLWGGHMSRAFYDDLWRDIHNRKPVIATIENEHKNGRRYTERVHIAPLMGSEKQPRFFLAAEPFHLEGQSALDCFGVEFNRFFGTGKKIVDTRFITWINRWFTVEQDVESKQSPRLAVDFIESELVSPLQERYAAREEDRLLIEAAQVDVREFRRLYIKYESLVKQYFLRHLGYDSDTADDLTQDTFYRALSALPGFTSTNASYGTYVLRVAHNILVNYYRKKRTVHLFDDQLEERVSLSTKTTLLFDQWFDFAALRKTEQHILSLKYREGFSIHEIAVFLGVSENAVKLRLSRARKHLKSLL